ncbi:MAG TPA: hypothetical protein VIV06_03745 [Candidatus Limnocylindrales bacterium]
MPTTLPPTPTINDQLRASVDSMHGRARLDAELTRLAIDVVGPYDSDVLPPAQREWLEERVSRAVQVAIEPALAAFMEELARGLVEAPDDLLARVTRAKLHRDVGGE